MASKYVLQRVMIKKNQFASVHEEKKPYKDDICEKSLRQNCGLKVLIKKSNHINQKLKEHPLIE